MYRVQGWPSRAESRSSASRLDDSAKMSASRLGGSGDSALTRAMTQPAGVSCRIFDSVPKMAWRLGVAARCRLPSQGAETSNTQLHLAAVRMEMTSPGNKRRYMLLC